MSMTGDRVPRITSVRAWYPRYDPPRPGWRARMWQMVVELETNGATHEGKPLRGLGVGGGGVAACAIVNEHFAPLLVGQELATLDELEPEPVVHWEIERFYDLLYRASLPYGRKGVALMAVSGVDLALWDLFGRALHAPISELIGGGGPRPVPAYATTRNLERALQQGFRAIKLAHAPGPEEGEAGVRFTLDWLRKARDLGGDEIELMVDAWMGWDVDHTLRMAERMAEYHVAWIEEPLIPDDFPGYQRLCREVTTTLIAHGEHEFTEHGFRELIDRGAAQIIQPDFTWCGGFTAALRIAELAQRAGLPMIPHRGGEPWAYQWITAMARPPRAEVVLGDGDFPAADPKLVGAPRVENGMVIGENRAGFGVKLPAPEAMA